MLTADISRLIVRDLEAVRREIAAFPDDDLPWRVLPGVTNSAGCLALHLAGNLQHFVGACLGGTGYVRDRAAEFSTRSGTRAQIDAHLQDAITAVSSTLAAIDPAALTRPMPGAPAGLVARTDLFLMHLVAHTAFHLGQAGYLRRVLTGDGATSVGPMEIGVLADS